MTLYVVSYDRGFKIDKIESEKLRRFGRKHPLSTDDLYTLFEPGKGHFGNIWRGSQIFTSKEGACAYIDKNYNTSNQLLWDGKSK